MLKRKSFVFKFMVSVRYI